MNIKVLEELIKQGEGQTVEFKLRPSEEIGKSICAFANSNDGHIFVGVSDSKDIIGISEKMEMQAASIAHSCKPSIYPEIRKTEINDKTILVVNVKRTGSIHAYKNIAYRRVGSHNQPLSPEAVIEFAKSAGKINFDEQINSHFSSENVEEEKVRWFLKKAKSDRNLDIDFQLPVDEILEKLGLIIEGELTNSAILLFGKNPQRDIIQSEIRCARFKGTKAVKPFIDMKVIGGTVYEQIEQAEKFVLFNIKKAAWIEPGMIERQERWEYPPDAIREAITNAVAHRDYFSSANVQIRIFDDRIEIWNPGSLPEGLTVEKLKGKHESRPKNKLLARMFFLIKYIEQWGTGTNEIIEKCLEYNLPEPQFEDTGSSFIVTLWKSRSIDELLDDFNLNERQKKALKYLKDNKRITNSQYVKMTGISRNMATNDLKQLADKKVLKQVGTGRGSYYELI